MEAHQIKQCALNILLMSLQSLRGVDSATGAAQILGDGNTVRQLCDSWFQTTRYMFSLIQSGEHDCKTCATEDLYNYTLAAGGRQLFAAKRIIDLAYTFIMGLPRETFNGTVDEVIQRVNALRN